MNQSHAVAEGFAPPPAFLSLKSLKAPLLVPAGWSRVLTKNPSAPKSVYYVTPSGRILLSIHEVLAYLSTVHTCKCNLDMELYIDEVFDFDPSHPWTQEVAPRPNTTAQCLNWNRAVHSDFLRTQTLKALAAVHDNLVCNSVEVYEAITGNWVRGPEEVEQDEAYQNWLAVFEWEQFLVTREGEKFVINLSRKHHRHLAYEFTARASGDDEGEESGGKDAGTMTVHNDDVMNCDYEQDNDDAFEDEQMKRKVAEGVFECMMAMRQHFVNEKRLKAKKRKKKNLMGGDENNNETSNQIECIESQDIYEITPPINEVIEPDEIEKRTRESKMKLMHPINSRVSSMSLSFGNNEEEQEDQGRVDLLGSTPPVMMKTMTTLVDYHGPKRKFMTEDEELEEVRKQLRFECDSEEEVAEERRLNKQVMIVPEVVDLISEDDDEDERPPPKKKPPKTKAQQDEEDKDFEFCMLAAAEVANHNKNGNGKKICKKKLREQQAIQEAIMLSIEKEKEKGKRVEVMLQEHGDKEIDEILRDVNEAKTDEDDDDDDEKKKKVVEDKPELPDDPPEDLDTLVGAYCGKMSSVGKRSTPNKTKSGYSGMEEYIAISKEILSKQKVELIKPIHVTYSEMSKNSDETMFSEEDDDKEEEMVVKEAEDSNVCFGGSQESDEMKTSEVEIQINQVIGVLDEEEDEVAMNDGGDNRGQSIVIDENNNKKMSNKKKKKKNKKKSK